MWLILREVIIQNELDDLFVVKKGLGVDDKIIVEGIQQVHDGEKVEYEYRAQKRAFRIPGSNVERRGFTGQ